MEMVATITTAAYSTAYNLLVPAKGCALLVDYD